MPTDPAAPHPAQARLNIEWRGRERFAATWARQLELHALRKAGEIPDTLVLVEHEPVVTLGRQGDAGNLLLSAEALAARGFDLHRIERGGDVTYHGPGQLVGYPIFHLRELGLSVHQFVWNIEEALIRATAHFGVTAQRVKGLTGVWVEGGAWQQSPVPADSEQQDRQAGAPVATRGQDSLAKLAAIGVAIQGAVSFHGFAYNVSTDLSGFQTIVPCGITQHGVTSLEQLLCRSVALSELQEQVVSEFQQVFGLELAGSTLAAETPSALPASK